LNKGASTRVVNKHRLIALAAYQRWVEVGHDASYFLCLLIH